MSEETKNCPVCGEDVKVDAVKCEHCDSEITDAITKDEMATENKTDQLESESPEKASSEINTEGALWNPNAASAWSILFTPIFGSILIMKNWKTLNNEAEAKKGLYWLIGTGILLVINVFIIDLSDFIFLALLIAWYFLYAKKQVKYIKDTFHSTYKRNSWKTPLLSGFAGFTALVFVIMFFTGYDENDLIGTWNFDADRMVESVAENPDSTLAQLGTKEEVKKFLMSRFGNITFTIIEDNQFLESDGVKKEFEIIDSGSDYFIVRVKGYMNKGIMFEFMDDDEINFYPDPDDESNSIPLKKVK